MRGPNPTEPVNLIYSQLNEYNIILFKILDTWRTVVSIGL